MLDWFMEGCMMLSDWPLGGRGGIWLPAPDRENKPIMAKPGILARWSIQSWKWLLRRSNTSQYYILREFQQRGSHLPSSNAEEKLCRHHQRFFASEGWGSLILLEVPLSPKPSAWGYLALQQARVVLSEIEQHWRESQQGTGTGLGCQAGAGRYEEKKETELGYSALLGCWKSLMCSLQGSELLLSPWGDHLLNQTDPETYHNISISNIKQKNSSFNNSTWLTFPLNNQGQAHHTLCCCDTIAYIWQIIKDQIEKYFRLCEPDSLLQV